MEPPRYSHLKLFVSYSLILIIAAGKSFPLFSVGECFKKQSILFMKAYGLLVLLGFDISTFTPATYQRGLLPQPLKEVSSWSWFRA